MGEVEPIRLAVNKLLEGADPILEAFHDRRMPPSEAARRMGRLEQRFAGYAVDIAAVDPPTAQLRALNSGYANTYVLEDAYLSALAAGLGDGELTNLPNTQAAQRAAGHPLADRPYGPGPWRRRAPAGRPAASRPRRDRTVSRRQLSGAQAGNPGLPGPADCRAARPGGQPITILLVVVRQRPWSFERTVSL